MLLICYCYWYYWWECDMYVSQLLLKKPLQSFGLLWQYLLIALDRLWPVNLLILFTLLSELVIINLNVMKGHMEFWGNLWSCTALYVTNEGTTAFYMCQHTTVEVFTYDIGLALSYQIQDKLSLHYNMVAANGKIWTLNARKTSANRQENFKSH